MPRQMDVEKGAVTLVAAPRNPIQLTRRNHLDLGIIWRQPDRDWDLTLRGDDTICAIPGSHGGQSRDGRPLTRGHLDQLYKQPHNQSPAA